LKAWYLLVDHLLNGRRHFLFQEIFPQYILQRAEMNDIYLWIMRRLLLANSIMLTKRTRGFFLTIFFLLLLAKPLDHQNFAQSL